VSSALGRAHEALQWLDAYLAQAAIALAQCDDPLIKQAGLRFG